MASTANRKKTGKDNEYGEHTSKPSWALVWRGNVLRWFTSAHAASLNCISYRQNGWDGAYVEFHFNQEEQS